MQYRSEIDGLRALAVLPVILFHAGFSFFSGGFVGVDIFFVISGYLITSIITNEITNKSFSIINFYERRARRILPPLFFVIILCIPFAWFWMLPDDFKNFGQSITSNIFFISNFLFWIESSYFAGQAELKPLLHTWSLAVEEQFYVLFPIILLVFLRLGKNLLFMALTLIAILSLFYSQYSSIYFPDSSFYLLPSRAWELLLGSAAALILIFKKDILIFKSSLINEILCFIGIALIAYAIYFFDRSSSFPGFPALVPTLGTFLLILFCNNSTLVGKFLSQKLIVGFGLISYSLYVFHQPIFVFARLRSQHSLYVSDYLMLIGLAILLAYLSWKYVEKPFRDKSKTSRKTIFSVSLALMFFLASFGLIAHLKNGFPNRFDNQDIYNPEFSMPSISNGWCFYDVNTEQSLKIGKNGHNCFLGKTSSSVKGLLFGDSFAGHYEPAVDIFGKEANINIHSITTNWCFPSIDDEFGGPKIGRMYDQCNYNKQYLLNNINDYQFIIFSGDWANINNSGKIEGVMKMIKFAATNNPLVIILPSPKIFDHNILDFYKRSLIFNFTFNSDKVSSGEDKEAREINGILEDYSKEFSNVLFIKRQSLFNVNGSKSDVTYENIPFSLDRAHISTYGSLNAGLNFVSSNDYKLLMELMSNYKN